MFRVWPISNCNISSNGCNLCIWCIGLFDKQITFLVHFPPSIFACLNLHQEAPLTCFRVGWFSCTINILTTTRSFWLKRRANDRIFSLISKTSSQSHYNFPSTFQRNLYSSPLYIRWILSLLLFPQYLDVNTLSVTKWWMFLRVILLHLFSH